MPWWPALRRRASQLVKQTVKRAVIQHHRRGTVVLLSDTTLRDGEQMPGATLEPHEKLEIAIALAELGVHSIDAGFPASSEADFSAIRRMVGRVHGPVLTALCRTVQSDIDRAREALDGQPVHKRGVSLFLGTSPLHRRLKHQLSQAETLNTIAEMVHYASQHFEIVAFSPEDASRTEPEFLCQCYETAIQAGATTVGFPDTVGICTPEMVYDFLDRIQQNTPSIARALLAVHFHNDLGLAVANSLAGIAAGAHVVQGTINGLGERAGNASLEEVAVALSLHATQYGRTHRLKIDQLTRLCQRVAELTGIALPRHKPIAGVNVFSTEAGIHQDGLLKHPEMYQPFPPSLVGGGPIRLIIGRHSGKRAVAERLAELGVCDPEACAAEILRTLKTLPKGTVINDALLVALADHKHAA